MKRMLLLVFTFVVATMCFSENFVEELTIGLQMKRLEVQECVNKTGITVEDIMRFDQIMEDGLESMDFDEKALKIGCFSTCLIQKKDLMTGARINMNKIKEMMHENNPDKLALYTNGLNTCDERVRNITNECEVSLMFWFCYLNEMRRQELNDERM